MTDIIMQRGRCVYWGCTKPTQGSYCREHKPAVCRICGCEPYGSRGLTYGMCLRHYKHWARHHSPQREKILAGDRRKSAKRTEARQVAARLRKAAQTWDEPWQPGSEAERLATAGWVSGTCSPPLVLLEPHRHEEEAADEAC